jgi:hypothetical protein
MPIGQRNPACRSLKASHIARSNTCATSNSAPASPIQSLHAHRGGDKQTTVTTTFAAINSVNPTMGACDRGEPGCGGIENPPASGLSNIGEPTARRMSAGTTLMTLPLSEISTPLGARRR